MGTKKGQVRKTARRAYEPNRNSLEQNLKVAIGNNWGDDSIVQKLFKRWKELQRGWLKWL